MFSSSKLSLILYVSLIFMILSCKKDIITPDEPSLPEVRTDDELLKDSVYYYYKLFSLWEESIPQYEVISAFTDTISSPQEVLTNLKQKTPFYTGYNGVYDRFSYFTEKNNFARLGSNFRMDTNSGYGLSFSIGAIDATTAYPIISMVEGGSPASNVALKRGDIILALNGVDMKIEVKCNTENCEPVDVNKFTTIRSTLLESLNRNEMKIEIENANNEKSTYTIANSSYEIDPLLTDTIYKFSNKNVGYFAYSSFEQIENNNTNQRKIDAVINKFGQANIKALIVDLRYNGGGYVDAATYMADKIINSNGNGKLMLTYVLNNYLNSQKNSNYSTFKDVYFDKRNNFEIETVCFLVSENTASASEMLINVLKPYMNVKVIAVGSKTYGKPVGFFPQEILNKISLWVTSFKLVNAVGESDYWNGLPVDQKNVQDYIFADFGQRDEKMIAAALVYTGAIESPTLSAKRAKISLSNNLKMNMGEVTTVPFKGALK